MGLPRSTYYDAPRVKTDDAENITAICDEFEAYGYRRVGAELRHRGMVVNSKKIRRLMRAHDLQPERRRRFVATTDSDHESDLSGPRPRQDRHRSEPAMGSGYHLYRDRNGVRLSGRSS
jgi:putative transposase